MIKDNTVEVDAVSGATMSSEVIPDMRSFKALISVLQRSVDYSSELSYSGEE